MQNHISTLKKYITVELLQDKSVGIGDDEDLLMSGLLDSINVVRLAGHIESTHELSIPPEDMIIENFGTLTQINQYIQSRTDS